MIKPTVGRVVLFTPATGDLGFSKSYTRPFAADVVYVWSDTCVNLMVKHPEGYTVAKTSVTLLQDGDWKSEHGYYCEWMPYQKGQAAKTEALEAKLDPGAAA